MKINETNRIGGINSYRKTQETKTVATNKKNMSRDEVQISSEAMELLETNSNRQKIESLKKSVATGTYQVDAGKIAEKILPHLF